MKDFKEFSWQVTEEEYRKDPALSYSTLAKYERGGFNGLPTLFDPVDSPSLLFGSCVDAIITGGMEEFNERFCVMDIPEVEPSIKEVLNKIFELHPDEELVAIEDFVIADAIEACNYQPRWKPETRIKVVREKGTEYYRALVNTKDKKLVTQTMYEDIMNSVNALKDSEATKFFFSQDNPFDDIQRYYQLKFKTTLNGIEYRCMFDELIVDNEKKTIQPVDLKTSYKKEWDFPKSFVEWNYQIQCRLYARILKKVLEDTEYKDYEILPYKDIVVCKESLTPLVWDFPDTFKEGILSYKEGYILMRDPEEIGKELSKYLETNPKVPEGININTSNDITHWLEIL